MRNKSEQMSLFDTYKGVAASMEEDKPKLFRLLDEHIDWDTLVPARFYMAFYQNTGRPRKYPLVAFLKSLVLQKIFCYVNDSVLLVTLRHSREMRKFCGFSKVPDAAKLTRFKQDFLPYIMEVFERLGELTEPICREMDAELAGSLIYDTTGIESYVAENNPKFFSSKLRQAKLMAKTNPNTDPYRAVYGLLPDCAAASPAVKQQYINGHFCYAQKAGLLTNGLGIVRYIAFFDDAFKKSHPEIPIDKCTDNPDADKELGDSRTLLPVLRDFKLRHPGLHYKTFVLRQEFAEDGGRVLELCAHGVPVPELEDAVLAGDLQCWVEAQEGIAAPAGAVGGGLQQEAVSAFGPENPQGLDWSDEVGEELPADGDIAAAAGCRQLTGFLQGWIVHRRSSFRGRAKQKHPPSTTMSQGRAKISLAVPPCFTA